MAKIDQTKALHLLANWCVDLTKTVAAPALLKKYAMVADFYGGVVDAEGTCPTVFHPHPDDPLNVPTMYEVAKGGKGKTHPVLGEVDDDTAKAVKAKENAKKNPTV